MHTRFVFVMAAAALVAGCSAAPDSRPAGQADAAVAPISETAASLLTITQSIAAGTDVYLCSYWAGPAAATFLVGASHTATEGTHHVLVFRTDLTSVPAGYASPGDCYAGPSNPMSHMRGAVYGSQARAEAFSFPPGVGLPVAPGEVFLVQVHLLDAGAAAIDARVDVTLSTATAGITTSAGVFFFDDPFIDIPMGAPGQASMRCLVPNDITLVSVSSYTHRLARTVSAFIDPASGPPAPTPFYASVDPSTPVPLMATLPVAAGAHLRFDCTYDNGQGASEVFQGTSETTDEMCVLAGLYYPAMSPDAASCAVAPDGFGTGTQTCKETLGCVDACPTGTAPPADLGLPTTPDVDPCWQRCVVSSCADASALLLALEQCTQTNCSTPCAAPASAACAGCQTAQCPTESSACANDDCAG